MSQLAIEFKYPIGSSVHYGIYQDGVIVGVMVRHEHTGEFFTMDDGRVLTWLPDSCSGCFKDGKFVGWCSFHAEQPLYNVLMPNGKRVCVPESELQTS
jgi:hypothetical protein